jgi:hypothetical protein
MEMPKSVLRFKRYFVILLVALAAGLLFVNRGAFGSDRVTDTAGNPLEGAVIIESWHGSAWNPVDSRTVCTGAAMAISDKSGKLASRFNPNWWKGGDRRGLTIFMRGYKFKSYADDLIVMEPNKDSYEKILYQVGPNPDGCGGQPTKRDGKCKYHKELAEERSRLAVTRHQRWSAVGQKFLAIECETERKLTDEERNAIYNESKPWQLNQPSTSVSH